MVGPAVAHHGWSPEQYDELAGAVVAGHVLECGAQATGGNFSGFRSLPGGARSRPLGFPLAEVAADGGCVITKHAGTGGAVTVDTVTAQLLYEIQSTRYLGPDVTVDLASVRLEQVGPDRVAVSGVRGEAPPEQLKVCVNELGGCRNSVELVLTGLDVEAKAGWVREQLTAALDPAPARSSGRPSRSRARRRHRAGRVGRAAVHRPGPDAGPVGEPFTAAVVELALGVLPGLHDDRAAGAPHAVRRLPRRVRRAGGASPTPSSTPTAAGRWWPTRRYRRRSRRGHHRHPPLAVPPPGRHADPPAAAGHVRPRPLRRQGWRRQPRALGLPRRLGPVRRARAWLSKLITPSRVRELVPEAADLDVEVFLLPNLGGVNVLLRGLLGEGVAASTRFDPQAKGLGEWVRSRLVSIEEGLT